MGTMATPEKWAAEPNMSKERSVSFLKQPGAENYPIGPLVAFLITIMVTDGADGALFPNVSKALERTVGFNVEILGELATLQAFIQAIFGPFWGVMCARGYMQRKSILTTMTFAQGLATLIMCFFVNNRAMMYLLRGINGACLAGLLPVANSIVADRFDDEVRGRMFALMNMSKGLGGTLFGALYSITSEWCTGEGRWSSCALPDPDAGCDAITPPCECGTGFIGWQYSLIATGCACMLFAPGIHHRIWAGHIHNSQYSFRLRPALQQPMHCASRMRPSRRKCGCGGLYTSLHYFYPRDMDRIFERRRLEHQQAEAA